MKKYILAICCMVFVGQAFAQVKTYFVHKKDGTTIELPVGTKKLDLSGRAVVEEDDYIYIEFIEPIVHFGQMPSIKIHINKPYLGWTRVEYETVGIYISKADEPQTASRILMDMTEFGPTNTLSVENLEFNTSYTCRAFVTYRGNEYYSREHSISFGKPSMDWYQLDIPEKLQDAGIYVHPSEAAWENLFARDSSLYTKGSANIKKRKEIMDQKWREYLTVEKARTLATQCDSAYDCADGTIYLLDEIGPDFVNMFNLPYETFMYGTKGLAELDSKTIGPDTIVCPESLNVPGNTYYRFRPTSASVNPVVTYQMDQPLLVGKEYEVEIVVAPDALNDSLPLPTKLRIYYEGIKSERLESSFETSVDKCDTLKYVIQATSFVENAIEIQTQVSSREMKKTHTREIRLVYIRVKSVDEEE